MRADRIEAMTTPLPIVFATAIPKINGPRNSATAVIPRAARGEMAREEIIVATMLLESLMPFRKAYRRAKTTIAIRIGDTKSCPTSGNLDNNIGNDVGRLIPAVGCVAQVAIDLA